MKRIFYLLIVSLIMISCLEEGEPRYENQNQRIISGDFVTGKLYLDPQNSNIVSGSKFGFYEIDVESGFYNEFSFLHSTNYKISEDGVLFYLVSAKGELLLYNKGSGKISTLYQQVEKIKTFDLSETEDRIVFETIYGEIKLLDLKTGDVLSLVSGRNPVLDPTGNQIFIDQPASILNTLNKSLTSIDIGGKIIGKNWEVDGLHLLILENSLKDGMVLFKLFHYNVTENSKTKVWEKQFVNSGSPDYFLKIQPNDELDKLIVSYKGNDWNFISTDYWDLSVHLVDLNSKLERKLALSSNKEIRSYLFDEINNKVYFSLGDPNLETATLYSADIQ